MDSLVFLLPVFGIIALIYMYIKFIWVNKQDSGMENMRVIALHIREGAMAFLKAEYRLSLIHI